MREALRAFVTRFGEPAEHVRGNKRATKQSLVGPLFTILGRDLTHPREYIRENRGDFGPNRSGPTRPSPSGPTETAGLGRLLFAIGPNQRRFPAGPPAEPGRLKAGLQRVNAMVTTRYCPRPGAR